MIRRAYKQLLRRGVSTLLALLLALQVMPAALAAGDTPEAPVDRLDSSAAGEPAEDGAPSFGTPDAGSTEIGSEDGNAGDEAAPEEQGTADSGDGESVENGAAPAAKDMDGWNQETGTDIQWKFENGTLTLKGTGATGNYPKDPTPWNDNMASITAVVVESGVTVLGDRLFINAAGLTSVTLPDTLTAIGAGVFRNCTALTEITIPSSVTTLGRVSFMGDTALQTFTWENAPGKTYTIGDQVFSKASKLTILALPTVTSFTPNKTNGPFSGCDSAPIWTAAGTITFAGTADQCKALFEGENAGTPASAGFTVACSGGSYTHGDPSIEPPKPDTKPLIDPDNKYTGYVGDDVRWTYDPATKTLTLTGTGATYNYPSDVPPWYGRLDKDVAYTPELEHVVIGDGITKLGDRLFINSSKLTSVIFPSSLAEIAQKTFMNCTSLVSLDLSAAPLATLGGNMFSGCSKLESVTFPATLTALGSGAFAKAELKEIGYRGTIAQYKALADSGKADDLKNEYYLVHCTDGDYYYGKYVIGDLIYTVINGVMTLSGTGAVPADAVWVAEALGVHTLVLLPGVTEIGANAFKSFAGLKTVCYIGSAEAWNAFKAKIGTGNDPVLNAEIALVASGSCGKNVTWSLSSDGTVLTISGSGPMEDYRSAKEAPWRYSADGVTTLRVESGVTTLGDYAFQNFKNLTDMDLPSSLERIGTYTFTGCYALQEIHIPEGVRIIAAKAFSDAKNLKTVYLPASLEAVDMKAFNYDTAIKDVYYAGTERQWSQIRLTNSGKGNANLLNATLHCTGTPATADSVFSDITGSEPYAGALDYLVEDGYLTGTRFDGDTGANLEMVLSVLYRRAGEPGPYSGAADWGKRNGLTAGIAGESLTAGELCLMLARTAAYNGQYTLTGETEEQQKAAALIWAGPWLGGVSADDSLSRAQAAVILAGYLQDSASTADRHDQIIAQVKAALAAGGDGKMYILAPDLTESTKAAKTGDCTLIVFPNGETMMIDFGVSYSQENVLRMVRELGLTELSYFVLTHPHIDHAGNALAVADYLYSNGGRVGTYYYSGYPAPDGKTTESDIADFMSGKGVTIDRAVHAGQRWTIGGVTVDVLGPTAEEVNSGNTADEFVNNVSLLLKMTYGSSTYLTGGDLYISQELVIIDRLGSQLRADVMKANHHGLYTSNSREWLEAVSPLVVVTENDDVGNSVVAEDAPALGIAYYSAGVDGDVLVVMDNARQYEVIAQYDTDLRRDYQGEIGLPSMPDEPDNPGSDSSDDDDDESDTSSGSGSGSTQGSQQTNPDTPAITYTDVAETQWFAPAVSFVSERGLMVGTASGQFNPEGKMTRAMMATVLHRLAGTPAGSGTAGFTDVAAEQWFSDAVTWAADSGLVTGMGGGMFAPNGLVTREQMAVMIYRMAAYLELDTTAQGSLDGYSDGAAASAWAEDALAWAVGAGILQGASGQLMPQGTASRAEIATVLMRFEELKK